MRSVATNATALALSFGFSLGLTTSAALAAEEASARFVDQEGQEIGKATLTEGQEGVLIFLELTGVPEGPHAIHLHQVGDCDDADAGFEASGSHINPEDKEHGLLNPNGPDPGDLPNVFATADGDVTAELFSHQVTLAEGSGRVSLLDDDGSAFVLHEGQDDHMSQPIGGAGSRIACGVVEAPN